MSSAFALPNGYTHESWFVVFALLVCRAAHGGAPQINTMPTDQHPSGYIVSDADDLLGLFDADYGVLVIGEGAKILGPNQHGQEVLVVAEYLRMKQFK